MRLPGDVVFIVGGVLPLLYLCYLGVRHTVPRVTLEEPEDIPGADRLDRAFRPSLVDRELPEYAGVRWTSLSVLKWANGTAQSILERCSRAHCPVE